MAIKGSLKTILGNLFSGCLNGLFFAILKIAKLYLDSPYQLGATGILPGNPTDCSKFTQNVFANVGIELERSSSDQAHQFSNGGYWYDSLEQAEI